MSELKPETLWRIIREQGVSSVVKMLSDESAIQMTEEFGARNYGPLPVNIVRAQGAFVYDGSGKEYIDCVGCYSAVAHGHLNDFICEQAKAQMQKLTLTSRAVYTSELALFLKAICEYTSCEKACPMNSGAEAVETAIKLARKWGYTVKGIPEGSAEIIAAEGNFHGRTITIISFSTEEPYREGFSPYTPGFRIVPFGDIEALIHAITPNTVAILLEPIQAEGGIIIPPDGYLEGVRRLCDEYNILLVWDEIQTGFCRTGKRFAWQWESAPGDLMCLGKALGGGLMPISVVVGRKDVMDVFTPGDHGSTFGGNPLACAVALAGIAEMETRNLCENSLRMGNLLLEKLQALEHPGIEDVRGRGLLIGLEVREGTDTEHLSQLFLENGIVTKETRKRTFRFAPPLTIDENIVHEIGRRVKKSLDGLG